MRHPYPPKPDVPNRDAGTGRTPHDAPPNASGCPAWLPFTARQACAWPLAGTKRRSRSWACAPDAERCVGFGWWHGLLGLPLRAPHHRRTRVPPTRALGLPPHRGHKHLQPPPASKRPPPPVRRWAFPLPRRTPARTRQAARPRLMTLPVRRRRHAAARPAAPRHPPRPAALARPLPPRKPRLRPAPLRCRRWGHHQTPAAHPTAAALPARTPHPALALVGHLQRVHRRLKRPRLPPGRRAPHAFWRRLAARASAAN